MKKNPNNVPNLWDKVPLRKGKLTGTLTDDLANAIWPSTSLKESKTGLEIVRVRTNGVRTSTKNH